MGRVININGTDTSISAIDFDGNSDISRAYLDGTLVWQKAIEVTDWSVLTSNDTSTSTGFTATAPAGTSSIVFLSARTCNSYVDPRVTAVSSSDGGSMTKAADLYTQDDSAGEYGGHGSIWAVNLTDTLESDTSITVTATYTSANGSGNYGKLGTIIFLDSSFSSYTPSDTATVIDISDPGTMQVNKYEGGLTVAVTLGEPTCTMSGLANTSNPTPNVSGTTYSHGYEEPTADETNATISITNVSYNADRKILVAASWSTDKF